ncbi:hypothetical protein N875_01240 [Neisseria meningitidis LNP21362]|nr:hypothetical protein N875_01240 [Neisseria meningitidis LNP21362]
MANRALFHTALALSDTEKRGQSLAADYGDDYAGVNRNAAECVEYLYVQRALRLDAGFEMLRHFGCLLQ